MKFAIGAAALLGTLAATGVSAQERPDVNETLVVDPAVDADVQTESNDTPVASEPEPRAEPAPEPQAAAPAMTPAPVTNVEALPETAENPYANSYNMLLPIEEERTAFDDWGLLGLLGLLGLFGLRGRERLVYVERADAASTRPTETL